MTHAKIDEDCSFVLLDGIAALKTTKFEIRRKKGVKDTVLVELSNTRELIWVDKLERWSANQLMGFKPCWNDMNIWKRITNKWNDLAAQ